MINTEMLEFFIKELYKTHSETTSNQDEFVLDDETLGRFIRLGRQATTHKCAKLFWKLFFSDHFERWVSDDSIDYSVTLLMEEHGIDDFEVDDVKNNYLVIALTLWAMAERRVERRVTKSKRWDSDLVDMLRKIITGEGEVSEYHLANTIRFMFARCYYHNDVDCINDFGVVHYQARDGSVQKCCYITHIYPHHRPDAELQGLADFFIKTVTKPSKSRLFSSATALNTGKLYALIVIGRIVLPQRTTDLQPLLVVNEEGCGSTLTPFKGRFPKDTVIFKTEQMARDFAQTWIGHPHWYKLNGQFKIIELEDNPIVDPYINVKCTPINYEYTTSLHWN